MIKCFDKDKMLSLLKKIISRPAMIVQVFVVLLATALLIVAFCDTTISGLFATFFLLSCGIVLYRRKDKMLCVIWVCCFFGDNFIRYRYRVNWGIVLKTFTWNSSLNYFILLLAWIQFTAILTVMIIIVSRSYKKNTSRKLKQRSIWGISIFVVSNIVLYMLFEAKANIIASGAGWIYRWGYVILDWFRILAFSELLSLMLIKCRRKKI